MEATPVPVEPMGWIGAHGDKLIPSGHSVRVGRFEPQAVAASPGNSWAHKEFVTCGTVLCHYVSYVTKIVVLSR